jgi:uncharacterized protein YjbI with pentapeptide repeats
MRPYPVQEIKNLDGEVVITQAAQNRGHAIELLVAAGRTDFTNLNLAGVDFRGRGLAGADFTGSKLNGCDMRGTKREGAKFDNTDITRTSGLEEIVAERAAIIWSGLDLSSEESVSVQYAVEVEEAVQS